MKSRSPFSQQTSSQPLTPDVAVACRCQVILDFEGPSSYTLNFERFVIFSPSHLHRHPRRCASICPQWVCITICSRSTSRLLRIGVSSVRSHQIFHRRLLTCLDNSENNAGEATNFHAAEVIRQIQGIADSYR